MRAERLQRFAALKEVVMDEVIVVATFLWLFAYAGYTFGKWII